MDNELIYYNNNDFRREKTCFLSFVNKLQINIYIFDSYLGNFTTERWGLQCMRQCDFHNSLEHDVEIA